MKTNRIYIILKNKAAILALFFLIFAPMSVSHAQLDDQTPPAADGTTTLPDYCTPLPEDLDQLQECNDLISQFNIQNYDSTGEQITGPGNGTFGMASAYNPTNNTVLFVSTLEAGTAIRGQLYNAETMAPIGAVFTIDQGSKFSGSPRIVYNNVTGNFFTTWIDERRGDNISDIYGRVVNADGSMPASDFVIVPAGSCVMGDLSIDYTNSRYVQGFDMLPDGPRMVTISFAGEVGPVLNLDQNPANWEGHSSVVYNSTRNEYWYTYVAVVAGNDTIVEDNRIMFRRVDAATLQTVGEPVQLSKTRIGRSAFAQPQIAYSEADGAAVVAWMERGRTPGMKSEVYGRTIYNDLTLSAEYPILTATTYPVSDLYGEPDSLSYNPATGTFAIAVKDNNQATTYVEFFSDGYIAEIREAIPPTGINGNFNPCLGLTGTGFLICTSSDYNNPQITNYVSNYRGYSRPPMPLSPPRAPEVLSGASVAAAMTQIYLWALGLSGLLAVVYAVFGGYLVMTASGNAAQATRGREFITSALVGLVLLLAAFLILNTLNPDLTDFDIQSLTGLNG
jgi:hypothetical protein